MFCCYYNLFAYTCKHLQQLGNNTNKQQTSNEQPSRIIFSKKRNNKQTTKHKGHPAHHSTANKYLRFRLDELYYLLLCVFLEGVFVVVCCCVLELFVYTCNSLNRLGKHTTNKQTTNTTKHLRENQRPSNTGHPAHHSTANKHLSGSGWMSCIFVCFVYLEGCLFVCLFLLECFCLYMQQLKQTRQK